MSKISIANLKKTIYYLQRNGLRDTFLAALERLQEKSGPAACEGPGSPEDSEEYDTRKVLSPEKLQLQRERGWQEKVKFSILVPAYRTPEVFLRAMIDSVLEQTYGELELILADASGDESVKKVADTYRDSRLVYVPLENNAGISENTNAALEKARGDYVALLDHDDVLTPDALYEMALQIERKRLAGERAAILYSDEDKCDETGSRYYEPHRKMDFNLDLLLSNNYICHFLAVETELARKVGFRREYDGAQDYDFVLRCVAALAAESGGLGAAQDRILHIPRILYHWRCHRGSTAVNPRSKMYAYEAGEQAVKSFLEGCGWRGQVKPLHHLGFYRVHYDHVFEDRPELGAVGGPVWDRKKKMIGGIYRASGRCPYEGLSRGFSGYMHRAALQQEAFAVDVRNMVLRPGLWETYEQVTGVPYSEREQRFPKAAASEAEQNAAYVRLSLELARKIHEKGYRILWDPEL